MRGTHAALVTAAFALLAAPAADATIDIELDVGGAARYATSGSIAPLSDTDTWWQTRLGGAWRVTDMIGVRLGFGHSRSSRSFGGNHIDWDDYTISAGAQVRVCLVPHLWFVGVADFELELMPLEVETGATKLAQTAVGFGFHPQAGVELAIPIAEVVELRLRSTLGYAFRTDLVFGDLRGPVASGTAVALDMGSVNLSGLDFATTVGVAF